MITLEGVLLFAFVLLPGAHARIAALRSTPIPWAASYRSQTQELIEILFYALVNGLIASLSLAVIAVAFFGAATTLRDFLVSGLNQPSQEARINIAMWLIFYLGYAIVVAEIVGSAQLLTRIRGMTRAALGVVDDYTHSTIWYWAIDSNLKQPYRLADAGARVTLKDGRIYLGILRNYPILGDDQPKDFALTSAEVFNRRTAQFESVAGPLGRVLLNSGDCSSLEIGPSGAPAAYTYGATWERVSQLIQWLVVLAISTAAAIRLASAVQANDSTLAVDSLDRLLVFVASLGIVISALGLSRLLLVAENRWDTRRAQTIWLLATLVSTLSAGALSFGDLSAAAGLALISLDVFAAVLLLARHAPEPELPELPALPAATPPPTVGP